ncbi:MAG: HDOD domain-containing protein [Desulfobacterales bacterium]
MRTKYVSTGSYWVGTTSRLALEAMLGSCVGVALYDPHNKVGGLHHILLPAPVHLDETPERYATTGLPLFLEAVKTQGADPAHLRAEIAGGALVGQLSSQDLGLDIGGRTSEAVLQFLGQKRIPIEQSVTGGVWGCRLRLEMDQFQVQIRPGDWLAPDRSKACVALACGQLGETMAQLTPIPQVALRILRSYQDEDFSLAAMAKELKEDQVLSARTLKLANSALFKRQRKIGTIEEAVFLLGQDTIIKWVVSEAVERLFHQAGGGYSLCQGGLFHHARKTALLCEQIAELTGLAKPASAYLAGLLHDIGKVVLDQYIHNAMPAFYRGLCEGKVDFLGAEREVLGLDHTEAGELLAKTWNFAPAFVEAIGGHHRPEDPHLRHPALAGIVYVADILLSRFQPGVTIGFPDAGHLATQLGALNLTPQQLDPIINTIADGEFHLAA